MPMLEVSRLSVQFGQKKIVDGLSFTVEEGQWLMIVGPNGAGKEGAQVGLHHCRAGVAAQYLSDLYDVQAEHLPT